MIDITISLTQLVLAVSYGIGLFYFSCVLMITAPYIYANPHQKKQILWQAMSTPRLFTEAIKHTLGLNNALHYAPTTGIRFSAALSLLVTLLLLL